MSVEDQVDGVWEASETIVSECDVTFELYRTLIFFHNSVNLILSVRWLETFNQYRFVSSISPSPHGSVQV